MLYPSEALRDDWDVGVRSFGCGGAYLLIGTAGAGIAFSCFLRLGAGTVFWFWGDEFGLCLWRVLEVDLLWLYEGGCHVVRNTASDDEALSEPANLKTRTCGFHIVSLVGLCFVIRSSRWRMRHVEHVKGESELLIRALCF